MKIAIIGAGPAGCAAARRLSERGADVTVFDKARGPGGRTSSRRIGDRSVDHGAPSLPSPDPDLLAALPALPLSPWQGGLTAIPRMSALCRALLGEIPLRTEIRATSLSEGLLRHEGGEEGPFDAFLVTVPAPQATEALVGAAAARALAGISMSPCWSVFGERPDPPTEPVTRLPEGTLYRESTKPARPPSPLVTFHASPSWSRERLEDSPAQIAALLAPHVGPAATAHRWRYARVEAPLDVPFLGGHGLWYAGDACLGGDVVGALRSGLAAADEILARS